MTDVYNISRMYQPFEFKEHIEELLRKQREKKFLTHKEKQTIKDYAEERRIKNQNKKQSHGKTVHQNRK